MLKTDLPNLSPLEYGRANELRSEITHAKTYAEMYPGSAAKINEFLADAASVDALPVDAIAIGAREMAITGSVQVGGTRALTLPAAFAIVDGAVVLNPAETTVTLNPGPSGQPGYPGVVTVAGNVVTGVTAGQALIRIDVRQGPAGGTEFLRSSSIYYTILVEGEA